MWSRLTARFSRPATSNPVRTVSDDPATAKPAVDGNARRAYTSALFCVSPDSPASLTSAEASCLEELHELTGTGRIADVMPRLSGTLPRLLASLRDDPPASEIAAQVAADPQLLSGVMKAVNSPALRTRDHDIENIEHALVILGEKHLREVIASVTFRPILSVNGMTLVNADLAKTMWEDAVDCASACRREAAPVEAFACYLCGMTHAVGLTAVLRYLFSRTPVIQAPLSQTFTQEIADYFPKISSTLIADWGLPELTRETLRAIARQNRMSDGQQRVNEAILASLGQVVAGCNGQLAGEERLVAGEKRLVAGPDAEAIRADEQRS